MTGDLLAFLRRRESPPLWIRSADAKRGKLPRSGRRGRDLEQILSGRQRPEAEIDLM